jgi:hypothetical protein
MATIEVVMATKVGLDMLDTLDLFILAHLPILMARKPC